MQHAERDRKPLLPIEAARANAQRVSFDDLAPPPFTGVRVVEPDLETLARFVDWQFFFHAWELKGKFPAILERPEARELYDDALALLDEIVAQQSLQPARASTASGRRAPTGTTSCSRTARASASCASSPTTATRGRTAASPTTSRRPATRSARSPSASTAPTSSPRATRPSTTTTARSWSRRSPTGSPRRSPSGCTPRRGAPGTRPTRSSRARSWSPSATAGSGPPSATPPAPTTARRRSCSTLLGAREAGLELTETFATTPAASVSGIYFAHPEARYFSVGRIGRDQVEDYAARKGIDARRGRALAAPEPRLRARNGAGSDDPAREEGRSSSPCSPPLSRSRPRSPRAASRSTQFTKADQAQARKPRRSGSPTSRPGWKATPSTRATRSASPRARPTTPTSPT